LVGVAGFEPTASSSRSTPTTSPTSRRRGAGLGGRSLRVRGSTDRCGTVVTQLVTQAVGGSRPRTEGSGCNTVWAPPPVFQPISRSLRPLGQLGHLGQLRSALASAPRTALQTLVAWALSCHASAGARRQCRDYAACSLTVHPLRRLHRQLGNELAPPDARAARAHGSPIAFPCCCPLLTVWCPGIGHVTGTAVNL
jgi:hypothetical protein